MERDASTVLDDVVSIIGREVQRLKGIEAPTPKDMRLLMRYAQQLAEIELGRARAMAEAQMAQARTQAGIEALLRKLPRAEVDRLVGLAEEGPDA